MSRALAKQYRAVASGRGETGVVLLDGDHLIGDALDAGVPIDSVLTDGRHAALIDRLRALAVPVVRAPHDDVAAASPVRSASGIVALARWQCLSVDDVFSRPTRIVVGLVGVQDPGNVGGIIRSAEALGASGVLALDDTADPAGWKALRGAMGSTFRLPVGRGRTTDVLATARARGIEVAATIPVGGVEPDRRTLAAPVVVLFGGEGRGLADEIVGACDRRLTIPMHAGANSLNVGVSAALILWEANRATPRP